MENAHLDCVLGIRTWDHRMEGANESTELWRHPTKKLCFNQVLYRPLSANVIIFPI